MRNETGTWAACVEGREEGGWYASDTREGALDEALQPLMDDVECGWEEPGLWTVRLVTGCVWHDVCGDEDCPYGCFNAGGLGADFDFVLVDHEAPSWQVEVEVYVTARDEDGEPIDFAWRERS